jgi:hypothetical protein
MLMVEATVLLSPEGTCNRHGDAVAPGWQAFGVRATWRRLARPPRACRDKELAKFEAFLNKEECLNINALIKPRVRMAYPIKRYAARVA